MNKIKTLFTIILIIFSITLIPVADVSADTEFVIDSENSVSAFDVAPCFGDNMVIQQNEPVRIWGTSPDEGKKVNVVFDGSMATAVVTNGQWEVEMATRVYSSEPKCIEIFGNDECEYVSFDNVTVGDVWLFIGQSNMEFTTGTETADYVEYCDSLTGDENVKLITIPADGFDRNVRWRNLNKYSAYASSALACYTAKSLNDNLMGEIPLGIFSMGYKGRELASFMKNPNPGVEQHEIYDNVISLIEKMPIAGIVWYQGEADAAIYDIYDKKMIEFIEQQRAVRNQVKKKDFPVYAIELSPCFDDPGDPYRQYIDFGSVRGVIGSIATKINNFFICPTSDTWNFPHYNNSLHPLNKKSIAARLTTMLLTKEYGLWDHNSVFAPTMTKYSYGEDETEVFLDFEYTVDGLITSDGKDIRGLVLIDENWDAIKNTTIQLIDSDTIRVKADKEICIIRYGCETDDVFGEDVNLCNTKNTPASAFMLVLKEPNVKKIIEVDTNEKAELPKEDNTDKTTALSDVYNIKKSMYFIFAAILIAAIVYNIIRRKK